MYPYVYKYIHVYIYRTSTRILIYAILLLQLITANGQLVTVEGERRKINCKVKLTSKKYLDFGNFESRDYGV
jgi:hypothetical protein